ncbi:hypothetical protein [Gramella sp. Hel_I_59]|uniref:hypothetical protein n=1 Tax=Gramella sp. Hel_I_59 TaxID=1249978 RepID=UPI0011549D42|nr:hypothetical protein [Gramella sp. Hel_I_59]
MNQSKFEIKDLLYLIIIAVAAFFIYQLHSELSGTNKALETLDKSLEEQKLKNEAEIRKIDKSVDSLRDASEKDILTAEKFQQEKEQLKNDAYENAPYHINDADSLASLITRRAKENR